MSIIQGGGAHNVDSAGAVFDHTIGQSLRFNDNDNAYLKRDITSSSNQRTWTWSAWVKRANLGSQQVLFTDGKSSSYSTFRFNSDDTLYVQLSAKQKTSSQVFRDVSAWYHFVWRVDTTQATDDDRSRIYVNGTQITSFSSEQHVNQNTDSTINQSGNDHLIGGYSSGTSRNFDGYMAEVNFVDGISYGPENFGETKDGVWIPKQYTGSYGTNGFHLDFSTSSFTDNSSDPDVFADQAGSNDFNAYNLAASDIVPDSPTNNFATLNVLDKTIGGPPISEGNLKISGGGSGYDGTYATIAVTSGKWYAEFLYISGDNRGFFGIAREERLSYVNSGSYLGNILDTYGLDFRARSYTGTSATSSSGSQLFDQTNFDTGDIGLLCFDVDAGKLWFGRRDVSGSTTIWYDSSGNNNGDPSAGSNPTYTFTATGSTWYIGCHDYAGTGLMANFGQDGSFAGEITSQGASDANGIGDFNYIETGFLALCTSNLPDITIGPGQNTIALDNFETMIYAGNDTEQHIGSGGARHPQDTVTIANSLRLNDDDSGKLYFDPSSDGNKQIFTFSAWVKRATLGVNYQVIFGGKNVGGNQTDIRFDGSDQLRIVTAAASLTMDFKTNRTFKSLATWYHIVVAVDTTDSTLLNRVKIYVDGVQETDLQTTICTVNTNCILNTATNQTTNVGALGYTTTVSNEFDG